METLKDLENFLDERGYSILNRSADNTFATFYCKEFSGVSLIAHSRGSGFELKVSAHIKGSMLQIEAPSMGHNNPNLWKNIDKAKLVLAKIGEQ